MTTTWLIQDTKHPIPTVRRLIRACATHGRPVEMISAPHSSTALPEILANPPFVFYGYSTLLINAHSDIRFRHGVLFDICRRTYRHLSDDGRSLAKNFLYERLLGWV